MPEFKKINKAVMYIQAMKKASANSTLFIVNEDLSKTVISRDDMSELVDYIIDLLEQQYQSLELQQKEGK